MERLSTQDASFLYVENEFNHMSIATVTIFEGPPPKQDEIESMVSSKLHLVPRYRQRVRFIPLDLGRPVWCDDPHFSLRYHVRHTGLPAPGSAEQLQMMVGRVMSQQLDRTKPLWELWVVEGLEDGNWAILLKMHHCVADGVAATDLLSALLDEKRSQKHPQPPEWEPEKQPSPRQLVKNAVFDRLTSPREGLEALQSALETPRRTVRKAGDFFDGLGSYRRYAGHESESSLNVPIGPHRSWRWVSSSLADVKGIRKTHGGTVNDIVLAVITRGFRSLLQSRGEPVDGLESPWGSAQVVFHHDPTRTGPPPTSVGALLEWIKEHADLSILIEGHCDERGTLEYNLALGQRRAKAVKDYYVLKGVSDARLYTISYGEERPVDPDWGEVHWLKNRRAEFKRYNN